jgi:tetratricopeptide (TPR) repeat protein
VRNADPEYLVQMVDEMLSRHGDSSDSAVQEYCTKALINKGWTLADKLNDPAGAVSLYDDLLHRYGDSSEPAIHIQCVNALISKSRVLEKKLNDPIGAVAAYCILANNLNDPASVVAVYDALLHRYGDSAVSGVQEQCAKALFNKGWTLNRMHDVAGAVACYDDLLARYSQSENSVIQAQCQMTLANTVEPLLVWGRNAEAIPRIRQVLARTDAANQEFAIMLFLLWLAEADTTQDNVLAAIRALSPSVELTWVWDVIRPLVDKLPEPRKTQAECFIAFFEQHHDIAQLESCLANSTENRDMAFP